MTPAQTTPWRGSLLPLGCAAAAKPDNAACLETCRGLLLRPAGASSLATGVSVEPNIQPNATHCGSGLARESGGSARINIECATLFASKPAPTPGGGRTQPLQQPDPLWEQSLLAKAAGQLASMLNMPPSSQASPLPHRVVAEHSLCNSPDPLWEQSLLAMKSTRFQTKTSHPNRRQTPLLQNLPTHLHQATHPCAFAYNYARIRPLVRLVPGFYCLSCHCPSVVGFSSPR